MGGADTIRQALDGGHVDARQLRWATHLRYRGLR
jgi:hypothetical protein